MFWIRNCSRAALLVLLLLAGQTTPTRAQSSAETEKSRIDAALFRLDVVFEDSVLGTFAVRKALATLGREPCDQQGIIDLGDALQKASFRREAADVHVGFSIHCKGHAPSLRRAVNILLGISDHAKARDIASKLIKLEPFNDNGYYLRAVAYDRLGEAKKAVDDYSTAIELFGVKERISSIGYLGLARNYDRLGRFCDAAATIEGWVSINPDRNETSQTRAIIAGYSSKGRCVVDGKETVVTVPIVRRGQVITVQAKINGVIGRFILDTGATYIAIKKSFADKAKVLIEEDSEITLSTANGLAMGQRGQAKLVEMKTLAANDVAIVVQKDQKGSYGEGIDGLLGMSFLSRFNVTFNANAVRIERRKSR
jgi:clan AA aspartic protease (TIGR02281 family)